MGPSAPVAIVCLPSCRPSKSRCWASRAPCVVAHLQNAMHPGLQSSMAGTLFAVGFLIKPPQAYTVRFAWVRLPFVQRASGVPPEAHLGSHPWPSARPAVP